MATDDVSDKLKVFLQQRGKDYFIPNQLIYDRQDIIDADKQARQDEREKILSVKGSPTSFIPRDGEETCVMMIATLEAELKACLPENVKKLQEKIVALEAENKELKAKWEKWITTGEKAEVKRLQDELAKKALEAK